MFRKEASTYTGDIDEKTYINGKRATRAAQTAGAGLGTMGAMNRQRGTRNAGDIALLGSAVGDSALGDAYTVEMEFRCK